MTCDDGLSIEGRTLLTDGSVARRRVVVERGTIVDVGPPDGRATVTLDERCVLSPGLIDLQLNGGFGFDFTEDPASIPSVASRLPSVGVTSFLPTIITSHPDRPRHADRVVSARDNDHRGATTPGLHLEGPLLSPPQRGTHPAQWLQDDPDDIVELLSSLHRVRLVTYAPELDTGGRLQHQLSGSGIVGSIGHSDASFDEASAAIDRGARMVTHLFNGMAPLHHRAPGVVGAALSRPGVTAGLIADGVHVLEPIVRTTWALKGPDRLVLVSDGMAAMGLGDGAFVLGDVAVTVVDGIARNGDGGLAGSATTLLDGVRNLVHWGVTDLASAVHAASAVPARIIGQHDRGSIDVGRRGDLIVLSDRLECVAALVGGRPQHDPQRLFSDH
ncbi:MAG: N-acetylglucosamine-6-phosphate deacetylase [Actinomycetota bacterium]